MRYKLEIPENFELPRGHAQVSALVKGAMAWKNGKPARANPYEPDISPSFYNAWRRGWEGAESGIISVSIPETRDRYFGKEIIRR